MREIHIRSIYPLPSSGKKIRAQNPTAITLLSRILSMSAKKSVPIAAMTVTGSASLRLSSRLLFEVVY